MHARTGASVFWANKDTSGYSDVEEELVDVGNERRCSSGQIGARGSWTGVKEVECGENTGE
jgi:hypothetical protein